MTVDVGFQEWESPGRDLEGLSGSMPDTTPYKLVSDPDFMRGPDLRTRESLEELPVICSG